MMKPLEILTSEHRVIEQVLNCLEKLIEQCRSDGLLNKEPARQALDFFRTFAVRCHHTKEEAHLFPALQTHGLEGECSPVTVMLREHELSRLYLQGMEGALEAAAEGAPDAVQWFTQHAQSYIRLLREHIQKEDHCLFPHAEHALGPEEVQKLLSAFERVETQEGGAVAHEKSLALANRLADRYGVPRAVSGTSASTPTHASEQPLRIGAEELRARLESGEAATLLDVRNDKPWTTSSIKIVGAIRVHPADWHIDPSWPKDRLTVFY
jgi:hemerythrin-like domain-containing protein